MPSVMLSSTVKPKKQNAVLHHALLPTSLVASLFIEGEGVQTKETDEI